MAGVKEKLAASLTRVRGVRLLGLSVTGAARSGDWGSRAAVAVAARVVVMLVSELAPSWLLESSQALGAEAEDQGTSSELAASVDQAPQKGKEDGQPTGT